MRAHLTLRNRQRTRPVHLRWLRQLVQTLRVESATDGRVDLGIYLVGEAEMTRLNEQFLRHAGSTDVITFDYTDDATRETGPAWVGEIFICVDEAVKQARRFRTTWATEMARYVVHGLLHLEGFDDQRPAARRRMKREENRRLRLLARGFALNALATDSKLRP